MVESKNFILEFWDPLLSLSPLPLLLLPNQSYVGDILS